MYKCGFLGLVAAAMVSGAKTWMWEEFEEAIKKDNSVIDCSQQGRRTAYLNWSYRLAVKGNFEELT